MSIEKYIIRINQECHNCGERNKIETVSKSPLRTAFCGYCSALLWSAEKLSKVEQKMLEDTVRVMKKDRKE